MTFRIDESNLKEYLKVVKPIRPKKTIKDKYRIAVQSLNNLYSKRWCKDYGDKIFRATAKVNKLEQQYRSENA